ncbi:MAG: sodium-dependent transporter [Candidatus Aminicenantales bacterium]
MAEMGPGQRGGWGSKLAFIFAASGSAIGLGSLWRFPIMVGRLGGAVYVFAYIVAVFFIGFTEMLAELAIGRHTQKNPVGAFEAIRPGSPWKYLGYMGVLTTIVILSYYAVVAGWAFGYLYKTVFGVFKSDITWQSSESIFSQFAANPWESLFCLLVVMGITTYIISKGIQAGVERFAKVLMPLLFALIILLAMRALSLPGADRGIAFYLKPELSKVDLKVLFFAIGQAFYSLSLGMGIMITYGSYISRRDNIISSAGWVCFSTTLVALLAGIIIYPTLFATPGITPDKFQPSLGLMFQAIPLVIAKLPGGFLFGVLFFVLLQVAALTSTISLLEVPVAFLIDEHKWQRKKAALFLGGLSFFLGIPSAFSVGASGWLTRFGFLNKMDLIFGNILLAIGGLGVCLFVVYFWGIKPALEEIAAGANRFRLEKLWVFNVRYLAPLAILILLIFIKAITR